MALSMKNVFSKNNALSHRRAAARSAPRAAQWSGTRLLLGGLSKGSLGCQLGSAFVVLRETPRRRARQIARRMRSWLFHARGVPPWTARPSASANDPRRSRREIQQRHTGRCRPQSAGGWNQRTERVWSRAFAARLHLLHSTGLATL
jgi:hypothetical protein